MSTIPLTWEQVNAWRLAQHGLAASSSLGGLEEAARRTGGIHAQVMSAAEWALGTRIAGVAPAEVRRALWQERTLIKTWAMRATLHLLAADDLPLYAAARSLCATRNWTRYFGQAGLTAAQYEAYLDAAAEILSDVPLTRGEFASALDDRLGLPALSELIMSKSWGTPLKPLAWRGDLCLGPYVGRNATYLSPRRWLGRWEEVDPHEALRELTRRYLRAYGPATSGSLAGWFEMYQATAREAFETLGEELVPVEVEGWPAMALRDTVEPILASARQGVVRLLPLFDAYLAGLGRRDEIAPLLDPQHYKRVFRDAGWLSAVVLVDGRVAGTWEGRARRSELELRVTLFSAQDAGIQAGIEAEAVRYGAFLGTSVRLDVAGL